MFVYIEVKVLNYGFVTEQAKKTIGSFFVWTQNEFEQLLRVKCQATATICLATYKTKFP